MTTSLNYSCRYCRRTMDTGADRYGQNPFCPQCLHERMALAAAAAPLIRWDVEGDYASPVRIADGTPRAGA